MSAEAEAGSGGVTVKTCKACNLSVNQLPGSRRTIWWVSLHKLTPFSPSQMKQDTNISQSIPDPPTLTLTSILVGMCILCSPGQLYSLVFLRPWMYVPCVYTALCFSSPGCGAFYDDDVARQVKQMQNGRVRGTQPEDLRQRYSKLHREKAQKKENLPGMKQQVMTLLITWQQFITCVPGFVEMAVHSAIDQVTRVPFLVFASICAFSLVGCESRKEGPPIEYRFFEANRGPSWKQA